MNKEIEKILEWLIGFAQMDLGNLTPGDRAKLSIEAGEYLVPKAEEFGETVLPGRDEKAEETSVSPGPPTPRWVRDLPQKDTTEFWDLLARLQKIIWNLVRSVSEDGRSYEVRKANPKPSGGLYRWIGEAHFTFSRSNTFKLSYTPIVRDIETYLTIKFYGLLNGFPRSTILTCPECKKFFINPSLRNKIFCSSRCMWRFNTRHWREKNKGADVSEITGGPKRRIDIE